MSAIKFKIGDTWSDLVLDLVYPVGSLYMSINSTSPAILFGGSWAAIENRMIIGASSTYAVGNTGGSATTTISSANLPTHVHSVGAHSHGLNSHKHSVGAHAHGLNSHTHGKGTYAADSKTLTGTMTLRGHYVDGDKNRTYRDPWLDNTGICGTTRTKIQRSDGGGYFIDASIPGGSGAVYDSKLTITATHAHTISGTSAAASGNTANSTAFDSGAASGSTANSTAFDTGNGGFANTAMTTISPYYSAYIWRRTA